MEITAYRAMEIAAPFRLPDPVPAGIQKRERWIRPAVLLILFAGFLRGQILPPPTPPESQADHGWWLRSASVYGIYYSTVQPSGSISSVPTVLGPNIALGGSAEIEWRKARRHSALSLIYIPSYTGPIRYSSWDALNQRLALNATWGFAPRWRLAAAIHTELSNVQGFLFAPTVFGSVASISPSAASLSASILGRQYDNTELAAILNSGAVESPIRTLLYGPRVWTTTARFSISHLLSPRLTSNFDGSASRYQRAGGQQADMPQTGYLIPVTTSVTANLGISYSVSPRTELSGNAISTRMVSAFNDFYTTTSTASLGRTLGRRWSVKLYAGAGAVIPVHTTTTAVASSHASPVEGATLGFTNSANTFLGSFARSVGDPYAAGASSTSTSSASWRWHRPDSPWELYSSFTWQQLEGIAGLSASSWRATAGWGRGLRHDMALHAEYAYQNYSGRITQAVYSESQSAVRISVDWVSLRPARH